MKARLRKLLDAVGLLEAALTTKQSARRLRATARRRRRTFRRRTELQGATNRGVAVTFVGDWPLATTPTTRFDAVAERRDNLDEVLRVCARDPLTHFISRSTVAGRSRVGIVGPIEPFLARLERDAPDFSVAVERNSTIVVAASAKAAAEVASTMRPSDLVLVFRPRSIGDTSLTIDGTDTACEVEIWEPAGVDGHLIITESDNPVSGSMAMAMAMDEPSTGFVDVPEFTWLGDDWAPPFDIDVVYTWVDGTDPAWRERHRAHQPVDAAADGKGAERYESFDELRYSLRSLWQHAPFFKNIYLVTDRQRPEWLADGAGVTVIDHEEIFRANESLPVFNSHAIESQLHHIPDLAEHYVYMNDDVLFGRNVAWTNLFTIGGLARFAESRARIPIRPSADDPAVDHSGANARALLFDLVGHAASKKIKHTPHPQLRSMHEELEQRMPEVYDGVGSTRFRSIHDISLAALFHHRYGEATGRAIPGRYDYDYVNLSRPDLAQVLERLMVRRPMTFCLNDAALTPARRREVKRILGEVMPRWFPAVPTWERSD